jgi:ubiquinone/menaquinone biosynthesis C-methylase UbiE
MRKLLAAKITRARLDPFIKAHASGARTLDIGCADSPYAEYFKNRVGFDVREGKGVDVVGDAHNLPFADGEFEQVLCTEVLEHLHTPERALAEMGRVLEPGGVLILTTRFIFPLHDVPGDYFRFTKYGLRHLLREWEVVELQEETNTLETIAVLLQRVAFQTELRGGVIAKAFFAVLGRFISLFGFLIKKEYGIRNRAEIREEKPIMSSGYYLVARKRS